MFWFVNAWHDNTPCLCVKWAGLMELQQGGSLINRATPSRLGKTILAELCHSLISPGNLLDWGRGRRLGGSGHCTVSAVRIGLIPRYQAWQDDSVHYEFVLKLFEFLLSISVTNPKFQFLPHLLLKQGVLAESVFYKKR